MFKPPFTLLFSLCFLLSCNQTSESKTEKKITPAVVVDTQKRLPEFIEGVKKLPPPDTTSKVQATVAPVPSLNNSYNNITAVLCGYKGKANNLNYLFDTVSWKEHTVFIEQSWKKLERKRLISMQDWGRKEFAKTNQTVKTIFYPFSGPDYLTANAFFPNADKYVMLGLEPVGKLPDLKKFKAGDHRDYSEDFKKSLGDIFDKSYFITRKMLQDFQSQKVNGLLPVLTFFIKRSGNEILDIKYLMRYHQDSIKEVSYDHKKDPERNPFGVRIDFLQEGKVKTVYYFKYDVSNKSFNDTTIFYKYLNGNIQNCVTYIKSASYLLHNNFMSNMKELILKNSTAVIQDDTGIPYKFFEEGVKFDVKLYGQYIKPVSDFPYLSLQKQLAEAFHRDSAKIEKLPFHLGYHWASKKDVIIYALRK